MNHKTAIREHAIRRFKERLGITLSVDEYHELCRKCNDRTFAVYKGINGSNQILLILNFRGWRFKVAYDGVKGRVVTVLPDTIQKLDPAITAEKEKVKELMKKVLAD